MSLWQYKGPRKKIRGAWYYDGNIIENHTRPTRDFFPISKTETTETIPIIKTERTAENDLRNKLMDMKMKDIRKIGKGYNAYDTSKKELVEEIIKAKKQKGEIQ